MQWNDHHQLEGKHAFLGASNFHWINWNDETFENRYYGQFSTQIGTAIHALAHDCIVSRTKLTKHDTHLIDITLYHAYIPKDAYDPNLILNNLIPFVNDALGFHMSSEILLYYNAYCFGTSDAISFDEKNKILRIHDLKTGTTPTHMEQLLIYAALFCLEYHKNPHQFKTELRIYQNFDVLIANPEPDEIEHYMDLIQNRSKLIMSYLEREGR
jgi:hypothetical protein